MHKFTRKMGKLFGGGGRDHRHTMSEGEETGLAHSNSLKLRPGSDLENGIQPSSSLPQTGATTTNTNSQDNAGGIQQTVVNFTNNVDQFFKSIVGLETIKPRTPGELPAHLQFPDRPNMEENGEDQLLIDDNTPIQVLLARIEFLENSLASETSRAKAFEEGYSDINDELQRLKERPLLGEIFKKCCWCCIREN